MLKELITLYRVFLLQYLLYKATRICSMSSEVVFVHYFYCKCSKIWKQYDNYKFESIKGGILSKREFNTIKMTWVLSLNKFDFNCS